MRQLTNQLGFVATSACLSIQAWRLAAQSVARGKGPHSLSAPNRLRHLHLFEDGSLAGDELTGDQYVGVPRS